MKCSYCHIEMVKFGFDRKQQQRFKCCCCGKTKTDSQIKHFDEKAKEQVDKMLKENISIRAMGRILGFTHTVILKYIQKKQENSTISMPITLENC